MEKLETLYIVGRNVKWYSLHGKQYGDYFKKLKIGLPCDSAISLMSIHPEAALLYSMQHYSNSQDMQAT